MLSALGGAALISAVAHEEDYIGPDTAIEFPDAFFNVGEQWQLLGTVEGTFLLNRETGQIFIYVREPGSGSVFHGFRELDVECMNCTDTAYSEELLPESG